jgi:hypothetical protein
MGSAGPSAAKILDCDSARLDTTGLDLLWRDGPGESLSPAAQKNRAKDTKGLCLTGALSVLRVLGAIPKPDAKEKNGGTIRYD